MVTSASVASFYCSVYRVTESILIRVGLWRTPVRHVASRIDRTIRRLWLGREVPSPATVLGHRMFFHPKFHKAYLELISGMHEPGVRRLFCSLINCGMNVVDLGANVGYYTLLAARAVGPKGRVYSFEPQQEISSLLIKNVGANGYQNIVRVVPKAVTNKSGAVPFFLGHGGGYTSSIYPDVFDTEPRADITEVETVSLDEFFKEEGWPPVDVMKMDIEGAEVHALQGMAELSGKNPSLRLIIEFAPDYIRAAGHTPDRFFTALQDLSFSKFHVIGEALPPLRIPSDIPRLLAFCSRQSTPKAELLCAKF